MPMLNSPVIDLALPHPRDGAVTGIATLGPAGTSSEASAHQLGNYLTASWCDNPKASVGFDVRLFGEYELAAQSVLEGSSTLMIIANAYHGASTFYMDPHLAFAGAYCMDTPLYGVATKTGCLPAGSISIASHPAPIPLVNELLHGNTEAAEIVRYPSTAAAAAAAAAGAVDAALTTAPAASRYGLAFATRTRTIRMLWSVFARAQTFTPLLSDQ